jgi:hypothetical protein
MPAMSPTMTEGGIIEWKFKEGESFSAGDVLLEVETDKANIDVEAQDDGKVWQIVLGNGSKQVPVGKPIAILAEPDDDLSTLTKPSLEDSGASAVDQAEPAKQAEPKASPQPTKPADTSKPASTSNHQSSSSTSSSSGLVFQKANPQQKFSPAVELLLHKHHISRDEALNSIQASGPNGRLLKADVLSHVGEVNAGAIESVTRFINSRMHLDLSNIVLKKPEEIAPKAKEEPVKQIVQRKNLLNVSFTGVLGELSQEQFKYAIEQSIKSANILTYKHSFPEYTQSPVARQLSNDDIFDELLVAPATKSRFEVSHIQYSFSGAKSPTVSKTHDLFDDLVGAPAPSNTTFVPVEQVTPTVDVSFKIKFDDKLQDSRQFVDYFTDSLLSQVPSNNIKVTNAFD